MPQTQKVTGVATNIRREKDGTLIVRYHSTDVVTVKADGSIVLDTGRMENSHNAHADESSEQSIQFGLSGVSEGF